MKKDKGEFGLTKNRTIAQQVLIDTKEAHNQYNWKAQRVDSRTVTLSKNGRKKTCERFEYEFSRRTDS